LPAPVQVKDLLFAALVQPPLTDSPTFWVASRVETKSIWSEVPGSGVSETARKQEVEDEEEEEGEGRRKKKPERQMDADSMNTNH